MALSPPISQEQRRRQRRKIPQFAVVTRRNQCRELLAHDTLHGEKLSIAATVKRRDFFTRDGSRPARLFSAKKRNLTRLRDEVSAQRRELPWVRVEKNYLFEGADGPETLADLFDGRSQLFVQHFMLGPDWEAGCASCSFWADHHDAANLHLTHHDSPSSPSHEERVGHRTFRTRMGWKFAVSSHDSDFNYDHVSLGEKQIVSGEASQLRAPR
jgi:predicted dithiol-disulfide oxidoreductase (DUF899 family)